MITILRAGLLAQAGLVEATAVVGLEFVHFNGMTGELYFPEMTGQGAALFDFDGDGDLDTYLVQGAALGAVTDSGGHRDVLLRNDGVLGGARWVDVSGASGLEARGYGMAVAVGDIDDDGSLDLFVGNYGSNELWRNRGDGTFQNVSSKLSESSSRWTTSAAFLDYDRDGHEDLYVVNYVSYSVESAPVCYAPSSMRDYCGPSGFSPQQDRLLRNLGDGSFEDVSAIGVEGVAGAGLGIAVLDIEGDGSDEVYVANDGQPNFLWRTGERWFDDALLTGVAVNRRGQPEASMGVAVADFDHDGDEDLFVTHLDGESNTLYVNDGDGLFDDRTVERGLAGPSLSRTGFGAVWVDLEHDGRLDLAVANGAVRLQGPSVAAGDPYPLSQRNQVFSSRGVDFVEIVEGPFVVGAEVSRGLVAGDVDNDGDRDLLLTNSQGPARLYLSEGAGDGNWLGVALTSPSNQRVRALDERGVVVARATSSGSYASATDSRVVFAGAQSVARVSISSRDRIIRLESPPSGRYLRIDPGQ